MAKLTKAEKQEALQRAHDALLTLCPPGAKVWATVVSVAPSGMSRRIMLQVVSDGEIVNISALAARLCGWRSNADNFTISGTGMDMCFAAVYDLSCRLHNDGRALKYQR
jgi:hypothetical protein